MYTFDKPLDKIVAKTQRTINKLSDGQSQEEYYTIYHATNGTPRGKLLIRCTVDSKMTDKYSIMVKAELYGDMGRNNQFYANSNARMDIAFAIGFTCATAVWRVPIR